MVGLFIDNDRSPFPAPTLTCFNNLEFRDLYDFYHFDMLICKAQLGRFDLSNEMTNYIALNLM